MIGHCLTLEFLLNSLVRAWQLPSIELPPRRQPDYWRFRAKRALGLEPGEDTGSRERSESKITGRTSVPGTEVLTG